MAKPGRSAAPLPADFRNGLLHQLDAAQQAVEQASRERPSFSQEAPAIVDGRPPSLPWRDVLQQAGRYLDGASAAPPSDMRLSLAAARLPNWSDWSDLRTLSLPQAARALYLLGNLYRRPGEEAVFSRPDWVDAHRRLRKHRYGLAELDTAVSTLTEFHLGDVLRGFLSKRATTGDYLDWSPRWIAPAFEARADIVLAALRGADDLAADIHAADRRRGALHVAGVLGSRPPLLTEALWTAALGPKKPQRRAAQLAVRNEPDAMQRGLTAIRAGAQAVRLAGAELLECLAVKAAVPDLLECFRHERRIPVRAALLRALEACGGDLDPLLERRQFLIEARNGLAKRRPRFATHALLETLPEIRWRQDEQSVAKEIVQWWVVQSIHHQRPDGGKLLRRSLEMCRPEDTAQLAKHVLAYWLETNRLVPARDRRGVAAKGALGLVAAAGDAACIRLIARFLSEHSGRTAQCKLLVDLLASLPGKDAEMLLETLAREFPGIAVRLRAAELRRRRSQGELQQGDGRQPRRARRARSI